MCVTCIISDGIFIDSIYNKFPCQKYRGRDKYSSKIFNYSIKRCNTPSRKKCSTLEIIFLRKEIL